MATAAVVAGTALPAAGADAPTSGSANASTVPFYGEHQAGVVTPEQSRMVFATYDVTAPDAAGLGALLEGWTAAAARMTTGKELDGPGGDFAPPPDTGEALDLPSSRLTVTVGFGPSLFDDRFGLASKRPGALVDLRAFPGDQLDPTRSGGDLCIQACADDPQVAFHAVHDLTRLALGSATVRYLQVGFGPTAAAGPKSPSPRNLLGFRDGTDNLVSTDTGSMDRFVWVDDRTDQPWMHGGTYLVARRIRIHLEEWDRSTLGEQERTIGRTKATGAPLGGQREYDPVDLGAMAADGTFVVPYDAHIRVAAADTNHGAAILRRGYSFADGVDPTSGELDAGLFFICFQKDPANQFVPVQQRLALQDALTRFVLHTGSGIFACPPGVSPGKSWGQGLL
jgi:deferrochelatase/peroxidase EfeB